MEGDWRSLLTGLRSHSGRKEGHGTTQQLKGCSFSCKCVISWRALPGCPPLSRETAINGPLLSASRIVKILSVEVRMLWKRTFMKHGLSSYNEETWPIKIRLARFGADHPCQMIITVMLCSSTWWTCLTSSPSAQSGHPHCNNNICLDRGCSSAGMMLCYRSKLETGCQSWARTHWFVYGFNIKRFGLRWDLNSGFEC